MSCNLLNMDNIIVPGGVCRTFEKRIRMADAKTMRNSPSNLDLPLLGCMSVMSRALFRWTRLILEDAEAVRLDQ
jgi:hypothetical protein